MASLGKIVFTGVSEKQYTFDIYDLNSQWNEVPVIYVVTRENSDKKHTVIYIGQTDNLKQRFSNHHKQLCFDNNNANRLCLIVEKNENTRLDTESDLVQNYKTPCND